MTPDRPPTGGERDAVDDGQAALDKLLARLAAAPMPADRYPGRSTGPPAMLLPVGAVNRRPTA